MHVPDDSILIGIDNLIYILVAISVLAISLPQLSADVRNMSSDDSPNKKVSHRKFLEISLTIRG
jgi:hypothetical protein